MIIDYMAFRRGDLGRLGEIDWKEKVEQSIISGDARKKETQVNWLVKVLSSKNRQG